jgi:hypothetical protein
MKAGRFLFTRQTFVEFPDLRLADFGTRRRHSFLWQDWCVQAMLEGLGPKFTGTSNCLIAKNRDLEAIGTSSRTRWLGRGVSFFCIGLVEKVLVADTLAAMVEPALARTQEKFVGALRLPGDETGDCFKFTNQLAEMAAALAHALGREVRHLDVPPEVYRGFGFPGADDLGNMFQFKRDFNADFCAARSVERSRALNPRLQTFAQWLEANAARIPLS